MAVHAHLSSQEHDLANLPAVSMEELLKEEHVSVKQGFLAIAASCKVTSSRKLETMSPALTQTHMHYVSTSQLLINRNVLCSYMILYLYNQNRSVFKTSLESTLRTETPHINMFFSYFRTADHFSNTL